MPLTLEGISKRYTDERLVLDGVDLDVRNGETVAIMGPSGSGKTTLLSIIGLLLDPSSGRVLVDGDPAPKRERQRHLIRTQTFGWILQTVNVIGRRTAADNVAIPLLSAGAGRRLGMETAMFALAKVGLADQADTPVRLLSGGEVQRVCIARALAHRPSYLLCDEPTGQLDHHTSLEVLDALWELLSATGSTLVVATHDPTVANSCGRVVDLVDGKAHPR